ncbi:hypothetical protein BTR23_22715 [Alkalihalophilus pseudofirmus]|uniref:DUF4003 family protein n=1 Tax=Alkalihalobacterium alkalinitrilicum TaxID=427920 RepID=UPI00094C741A|nr:DUF4003 family protein [Alkalihalobacterium alkalinitrilicum]OLO26509.1 hypothetical protein BTR23_22715 [Alkalihalophilus pseudofirmus]
MLPEQLQQKADQYIDGYEQLKKELKWRVSDRILMMVTSIYVVNNKTLNIPHFIELSEYIKNQVGMLSTLKSYQRFTIAALLSVRFENPKEKFHDFIELYENLVRGGFNRGAFSYIAAMVLLTNDPDESDHKDSIERALTIYKGMKAQHYFLTSTVDYPLAVLLAKVDTDIPKLLELTATYYDRLSKNGFKKGNDLQFLSHILSLQHETDPNILSNRAVSLFELLKQNRKNLKSMHYPEVGLLGLLEDGKHHIDLILQLENKLNKEKSLKLYKDMNFIIAVNFLMTDKMKESMILETGIFTTFEALMQAQQAAMIAAVSTTITGTSTSSSGQS